MDTKDTKAVETSQDESPVGDQPGRTHSGWREQARIRRDRWKREMVNDQPKSKWTLPEVMAWSGTLRLRWVREMDGIDDIGGSIDLWLSDDAADDIMVAHDGAYGGIKSHLYALGLSSNQSRPGLVSKEDCAHLMLCINKRGRPYLATTDGTVAHTRLLFDFEKVLQRYPDKFGELEGNAAEHGADEIETGSGQAAVSAGRKRGPARFDDDEHVDSMDALLKNGVASSASEAARLVVKEGAVSGASQEAAEARLRKRHRERQG